MYSTVPFVAWTGGKPVFNLCGQKASAFVTNVQAAFELAAITYTRPFLGYFLTSPTIVIVEDSVLNGIKNVVTHDYFC